jgi:hypothetical protein
MPIAEALIFLNNFEASGRFSCPFLEPALCFA